MSKDSFGPEREYEKAISRIELFDPDSFESTAKQLSSNLRRTEIHTAIGFVEDRVGSLSCLDDFIYLIRDSSQEDQDELRDVIASIFARSELLSGRVLGSVLGDSRKFATAPIEWADPTDPLSENSTPKWSTGCDCIDDVTGGGYGMVVVGGAPKVGKSLMAVSSAVEAARAGFSVVYANAEMSPEHLLMRFQNYMGRIDPVVGRNLHIANVGPGITIDTLYEEILSNAVFDSTDRVLIVLDSINRIVDFGCSSDGNEDGYWKVLADWSAWAMNSRRTTEGRISWLIVSELNAQGGIKGRNLEYIADMVIRMNSTGVEDVVEIDVPYSRATRAATIGPAYRDFDKGKFVVHG